jgi:hypothetical protein
MTRRLHALVFVALAAGSGTLGAQVRPQPQEGKTQVPRSHIPPPGMCRIWLDNVPPAQQPAPTDCASAVRNRPRNGRVVFSDQLRENPRLPIVKSLKTPAPKREEDPPPPPPKASRPETKPVKPPRPTPEP